MGLPPVNMESRASTSHIINILDDENEEDEPVDKECVHLTQEEMDVDHNVEHDWELSGVFDDHYDPRQVHSHNECVDINHCLQHNMYVALNSRHVLSVDSLNIKDYKTESVHCVKCKKEKTVQFIADSGASATFTFDKSDFLTYTEQKGSSIQTADQKSELEIQGYGSIFIKHDVLIKGTIREVTTKLQPVYYAPGMSYCLLSMGSLIQKGLSLHGERDIMSIKKPDGQSVMDFHPHAQEPSIYWLNVKIVKDRKVIEGLALSTTNSYDLWHRCLGHPSSDIVRQFSWNTVGTVYLTQFQFPKMFLSVRDAQKAR